MIRVTNLKCACNNGHYYYETTYFTTVENKDNGKKLYFVDKKEVTKDEGNNFYNEFIKKYKNISKEISVVEYNGDEYIKKLEDCIDPYTCYIEDYHQMEEAESKNEEIRKVICRVKSLLA